MSEGIFVPNKYIASGIYDMRLYAPAFFETGLPLPQPGQFMMLYTGKGEHLLPRPISICEARPVEKTIRLVFKIVGKGTAYFVSLDAETHVRIAGPFGNGFSLDNSETAVNVLIGGGVGIPPLLLLAKALQKRAIALLGFKKETFLTQDFTNLCSAAHIATEDGSAGFHGNAIGLLQSLPLSIQPGLRLYACGPRNMLRALVEWAVPRNIPIQISVEERMGCGYGACVGCAVALRSENDEIVYKKVCADGPVFDGAQVVFT
jgi:dihydroorotate dehydrogenase electron transfer subunit